MKTKLLTLTTDMGLEDHYVASIKGYLHSNVNDLTIIDISHSIKPFDVVEAAYHVASCFEEFPEGTIHVVGVDSEPVINYGSSGSFPSIMHYRGHLFISNDNGFFGALTGQNPVEGFYRINNILHDLTAFTSATKNILCKAAVALYSGASIEEIATPQDGFMNAFIPAALSEPNLIKGHVIHIDSYGNAITNVNRELFQKHSEGAQFTIYFKSKNYYIDKISNGYNEVEQGEKVAIFNENNLLEIAINRAASNGTGGANKLFGLVKGDLVRIEFTSQGSHLTISELF